MAARSVDGRFAVVVPPQPAGEKVLEQLPTPINRPWRRSHAAGSGGKLTFRKSANEPGRVLAWELSREADARVI